jgi:hypothetical protein
MLARILMAIHNTTTSGHRSFLVSILLVLAIDRWLMTVGTLPIVHIPIRHEATKLAAAVLALSSRKASSASSTRGKCGRL